MRIRAVVRGRVQGVGFRFSAVAEAERRGLVGWVRNTADGSVELEAEGEIDALEGFRVWLARGPAAARVDDVEVTEVDATGGDGFTIVR
jgi:acylphosphatase